MTDAEFDAMSAEQAWERCCYAAWVLRKQTLAFEAMRKGHQAFVDDVVGALRQHSCEEPMCPMCEWNRIRKTHPMDRRPAG